MHDTDAYKQLLKAFRAMLPREDDVAEEMPPEVIREYFTTRFPVLKQLSLAHVVNAVNELRAQVWNEVRLLAHDFYTRDLDRMCRCPNPACEFKRVAESTLVHKWPDPEIVAMVSPGEQVPLGLCPECGHPVYPPASRKATESEDNADATGTTVEGSTDATGGAEIRWMQTTPYGFGG